MEINNLPAGSIVLVKKYNLFQRFKAWATDQELPYNDAWIDPLGNSTFLFKDTLWTKYNVFTFTPKKQYSKKEMMKVFEIVLPFMLLTNDLTESLLSINKIRPNTMKGTSLEELMDNNKYYNKSQIK